MSILRIQSVLDQTGFRSHSSIYRAIGDGLFSRPVRIGQRAVGWPMVEVQAVNAARISGASPEDLRELVTQLHNARANWMKFFDLCLVQRSSADITSEVRCTEGSEEGGK